MNLIIDRGNYRVKYALFDGNKLSVLHARRTLSTRHVLSIVKHFDVSRVIISQVAPLGFDVAALEEQGLQVIVLSHDTPMPIKLHYKTPETLGRDRIAAMVGAYSMWPKQDVFVIDTGTCLTLDMLDREGNFHGGNIVPGPEIRFLAMNEFTAALPLVQRNENLSLRGQSTEEALQVGGLEGCVAEIEGWIGRFQSQYPEMIVVLSGGDADVFLSFTKLPIFAEPNLVLIGLNEILQFNAK